MSPVLPARPSSHQARFLRSPVRQSSNRAIYPPPRLYRATLLRARFSLPVKLLRLRRLSSQLPPMSNRRLRRYRLLPSQLPKMLNLRSSRSFHPPAKRHHRLRSLSNSPPVPPIGKFHGKRLLYRRAMLPLLKLLVLLLPTQPVRHPVSVRPLALRKLVSRRTHSRTRLPIDLSNLSLPPQHLLDLRLLHSRTRRPPRLPRTWPIPLQHQD
jgi:hypothetical protein